MRSAVSTCLGSERSGSTLASTPVNSIRRKGMPASSSTAAVLTAMSTGRRMTVHERRYQKPVCGSASWWRQRLGASALTRSPSTISRAGSATSEMMPAASAVSEPLIAIE